MQGSRQDISVDDRRKTQIDKQVAIGPVQGRAIGGEFRQDRACGKDLGFSLHS